MEPQDERTGMAKPGAEAAHDAAASETLAARYDRLRDELRRLGAAPDRDLAAIHRVIDELDATHMAFKAAHGLIGNNPHE